MRRFKLNKAALSIATAVLMITSMFSMFASSAATPNEITLTADKEYAAAGERINVSVGFSPNDKGAAGMTLNLRYDPSKVTVHIPTQAEQSAYTVPSSFSVITNYAYADGVVRIVAANLMSTNINSQSALALASFDVKSGVTGDIDFSIEVETMVAATDSGYENAPYLAPSLKLSAPAPATTTTTTTPATTTTTPATTPATTTTPAETTTPAAATTPAETTEEVTTTTTAAPAATTAPETAAPAETTAEAAVTTTAAPETTAAPAPVEEPEEEQAEEPAEPEEPAEDTESSDDAIFVYLQEGGDFNSETDVYYSIALADYISDYSKLYDLRVTVQASGNANGGIGMVMNGSWVSAANKLRDTSEQIWEIDNIDPSAVTSNAVVQLYYLKNNAEFKITDISFVESGKSYDAGIVVPDEPEITEEPQEETTVTENPEDPAQEPEITEEPAQEAEPEEEIQPAETDSPAEAAEETSDEANKTANAEAQTDGGNEAPAAEDEAQAGETAPAADDPQPAETEEAQAEENAEPAQNTDAAAAENAAADTDAATDIGEDQSTEAEDIEEAVIHASQEADRNGGSDPNTGSSRNPVLIAIMALCGLEILWSLFVIVYNRTVGKQKN